MLKNVKMLNIKHFQGNLNFVTDIFLLEHYASDVHYSNYS